MGTSVSEKDLCAKFGTLWIEPVTRRVTNFVDPVSLLYNVAQSTCLVSYGIGFFR